MKRRTYLKTMLAAGAVTAGAVTAAPAADAAHPILLHVDLTVDPAKEKEMLKNFETIFRPAASKQPGYIDVKMLKLRSTLMGKAPAGVNYRFALTYQSEELRQKWVASDIHKKVWPTIENLLSTKDYTVMLFDVS
jgi:heme-degrading monooxygenase HmoA